MTRWDLVNQPGMAILNRFNYRRFKDLHTLPRPTL